jgi:hypothetical protein
LSFSFIFSFVGFSFSFLKKTLQLSTMFDESFEDVFADRKIPFVSDDELFSDFSSSQQTSESLESPFSEPLSPPATPQDLPVTLSMASLHPTDQAPTPPQPIQHPTAPLPALPATDTPSRAHRNKRTKHRQNPYAVFDDAQELYCVDETWEDADAKLIAINLVIDGKCMTTTCDGHTSIRDACIVFTQYTDYAFRICIEQKYFAVDAELPVGLFGQSPLRLDAAPITDRFYEYTMVNDISTRAPYVNINSSTPFFVYESTGVYATVLLVVSRVGMEDVRIAAPMPLSCKVDDFFNTWVFIVNSRHQDMFFVGEVDGRLASQHDYARVKNARLRNVARQSNGRYLFDVWLNPVRYMDISDSVIHDYISSLKPKAKPSTSATIRKSKPAKPKSKPKAVHKIKRSKSRSKTNRK